MKSYVATISQAKSISNVCLLVFVTIECQRKMYPFKCFVFFLLNSFFCAL